MIKVRYSNELWQLGIDKIGTRFLISTLRFGLLSIVVFSGACSGAEIELGIDEVGTTSTSGEEENVVPGVSVPLYQLQQEVPMEITVTTTSLKESGFLQVDFTCEGVDSSPHIKWGNVPEGTKSIAIIAEDLGFLGGIASHWLIWGLSPDTREVLSGISRSSNIPTGVMEGINSGGGFGYGGPCPPPKVIFRDPKCINLGFESNPYVWNVYALDKNIALKSGADRDEFLREIDGSILASGHVNIKYISKTVKYVDTPNRSYC